LIFSSSVVIIALIPALFPALYTITFNETLIDKIGILDNPVEPFETGFYFISVVAINVIVFSVILISKFKKFHFSFYYNLSKRKTTYAMIILLVIFSGMSYQNILSEDEHMDWIQVQENISTWKVDNLKTFEVHVKKVLLITSFSIFGNYSVIPFLASAALLISIYAFTSKITNNRLAGLISVCFMLQSNLFISFSSIPTYTIFWALFYLISIYGILQKKWYITPISYVLAIFSKPLVIAYLPVTVFFVLNSKISNKKKLGILITTIGIVVAGGIIVLSDETFQQMSNFDLDEFMIGFTAFSYQMRFDWLSVVFLFPIIGGLFLISKNNTYANSISIMISGILFSVPLLAGMTEITSQPYRFVPLVVFLAVATGMILGRNKS